MDVKHKLCKFCQTLIDFLWFYFESKFINVLLYDRESIETEGDNKKIEQGFKKNIHFFIL